MIIDGVITRNDQYTCQCFVRKQIIFASLNDSVCQIIIKIIVYDESGRSHVVILEKKKL